jgi:hypothetical protein
MLRSPSEKAVEIVRANAPVLRSESVPLTCGVSMGDFDLAPAFTVFETLVKELLAVA